MQKKHFHTQQTLRLIGLKGMWALTVDLALYGAHSAAGWLSTQPSEALSDTWGTVVHDDDDAD